RERMREFHSDQVVAFRVVYAKCPRTQRARSFGQGSGRGEGRAGYFQQNLRGQRQRTANRYERTPSGDVKGCGKVEERVALRVPISKPFPLCFCLFAFLFERGKILSYDFPIRFGIVSNYRPSPSSAKP